MLLGLIVSAVLTALGALSVHEAVPITTLAAINTAISGILALLHNSGLPDRYRSDREQFYRIEEHLRSIIDSRLVPADDSVNEVLADCFAKFQDARQTVIENIPASYIPAAPKSAAPARASHLPPKDS